jgi:peptide/nickel transport system permease protein
MWIRRLARQLIMIAVTVALGGFLGATLARWAPGFSVDENELDPRLNRESVQALRQSRAQESNIFRFYGHYWAKVLRGDLGVSRSLGQPVRQLLAQRLPVTFRNVALGLLMGWLLGLALALPAALRRSNAYDLLSTVISGAFLCLPSTVLAMLLFFLNGAVPLVIGLVIFPTVFRYVRNLIEKSGSLPHILTAQAKGLGRFRILMWHILPVISPEILALAGVSVNLAFGASIPVEVICGSPGIGQLAWLSALSRDLPVLVNLTVLVTVVTLLANSVSDFTAVTVVRPQ